MPIRRTLCALRVRTSFPDFASQSRITSSAAVVARSLPSAEKDNARTPPVCPPRVASSFPVAASHSRTWQRAPTPDEMKDLIDGYVRDEILYREGVALGLDRGDQLIRRRVRQKLEFFAESTNGVQRTSRRIDAMRCRSLVARK